MEWERIFRHYPAPSRPVTPPRPLGGGLSGARVWRIETAGGPKIVRRHAAHYPDRKQLTWLHRTLRRLDELGWRVTPLPLDTQQGRTWVHEAGHLWEIVDLVPGSGEWVERRCVSLLWEACRRLARFHQVARSLQPQPGRAVNARAGPPRSMVRRIEWLDQYHTSRTALQQAVAGVPKPHWRRAAEAALEELDRHAAPLRDQLRSLAARPWPCQVVMRDLRAEDVFFDGRRFGGFVDFTALGHDTCLADLARLVGTTDWTGLSWERARAAYESVARLDGGLHELELFDRATRLCALKNWLVWTLLEQRSFAPPRVAFARIARLLDRPSIAVTDA